MTVVNYLLSTETILAVISFVTGALVTHFFLNDFFYWLDELIFGKSKVQVFQLKIRKTRQEDVNRLPGGFKVFLLSKEDKRYIIFKDVRHDSRDFKGTIKFDEDILNELEPEGEYYSIITRNKSSRRKLKKPVIKVTSEKELSFNEKGFVNVINKNCAGFGKNDFCEISLKDLKPGEDAAFYINGQNINVPEYQGDSRVKTQVVTQTDEMHILPLGNENMIGLKGLCIALPETVNEELSIFMLVNNPTEWIPLNASERAFV